MVLVFLHIDRLVTPMLPRCLPDGIYIYMLIPIW